MTNRSSNQNQPPRRSTGALPSLQNLAPQALLPITPDSSVETVIQQIEAAGAQVIELLVPNDTHALQSVAGCDLLRQAATKRGIRLTLFTADEKTLTAANLAKLDVVPVGGAVAQAKPAVPNRALDPNREPRLAPRATPPAPAAAPPARNVRPAPATQRPAQSPAPRPPANEQARRPAPPPNPLASNQTRSGRPGDAPPPRVPPASEQVRRPAPPTNSTDPNQPRRGRADVAPPARTPLPSDSQTSDADFLASLATFDDLPDTPGARLLRDDQGGVLWDTPGDAGVRRPALDTEDWDASFAALGATMAAEPEDDAPAPRRRPGRAQSEVAPRRTQDRAAPLADPRRVRRTRPDDQDAEQEAQPRRRTFLAWPLAVLALLVLLAGGWWFLQQRGLVGATPTLELMPPLPQTAPERINNIVIPLTTAAVTDTAAIAVRALLVENDAVARVPGTAEASTITPIGKATGTLVLRNTTSSPIEIPVGTEVQGGGIPFRFDTTVFVPAASQDADGVRFGRTEASVTSTVPGAQGNLAAGIIGSVPGYEGTIRVDQVAFGGGTDQEVRVVRIEDVNKVLPQALSQLYSTGVQVLNVRTAEVPGWTLPAGTITPTLQALQKLAAVEYGVFPPIGSPADENGGFVLEVRARFQALAQPAGTQGLDQQLADAVRRRLISTNGVDQRSTVTLGSWVVRDQTLVATADVQPYAGPITLSAEVLTEVQGKLAGTPRASAEALLQQYVAEGKIGAMPSLPAEWSEVIPSNLRVVQAVTQP